MGARTYRTVLIGAGNVATHLGQALRDAGHTVLQVYSRTEEHARDLANKLQAKPVTEITDVCADAELYVLAVRDEVLPGLAARLYVHLKDVSSTSAACGSDALFLHTAGSMPLEALPMLRRGVLYPMQTFSKARQVDFRSVPLFVESHTDSQMLQDLAESLSERVRVLDSESRKYLHLAAVFACNFTNHMYHLCADILKERGIPFDVMLPLIDETARKVHELSPREAQTGPAVRYDKRVMNHHLDMLEDENTRKIYKLLSENIHDKL